MTPLFFKAWELSGNVKISNPLAQDSPALGRYLMRQFVQGIAGFEDYAFLQGNGAAKPQGIINANASIPVTRQTGGQITFQDVSLMLSKLPPGSLDQAVFLASPTALTNLLQLRDGPTAP